MMLGITDLTEVGYELTEVKLGIMLKEVLADALLALPSPENEAPA